MTRHHHRHEERGAAATALLVTALLVGLAIFVYIAVPYGTASDAKAGNRTAADAAALAGAESARDDLLAVIAADGIPGAWADVSGVSGLGGAAAAEYAGYNGARIVEYYFDASDGTASATVEGDAVQGEVPRSEAVAEVDLPVCDIPEIPTPTPTPTPTTGPGPLPSDPPTPTDPPTPDPIDLDVDCGPVDLELQVRFDEDGNPQILLPPGQLSKIEDAMDVRLID